MPTIHLALTPEERSRLGDDPSLRGLVERGLTEERAGGWPFLSDVLAPLLHGARAAEEARGVVTAALHGLVKYDRLLDFALGGEKHAGPRLDALLALADPTSEAATALDARLSSIEDPAARAAVTYSLPDWIVRVLQEDVGVAAGALERACDRLNGTAPQTLRVNTLRATRDACIAELEAEQLRVRPTAHASAGLVLLGRRSPFRTRAFAEGRVEMQDEASQLVAEVVAPPPGSLVIDACAGAGGKTLALAALLGGRGRIVAIDSSERKLDELRRRTRRAGVHNVQALPAELGAERAAQGDETDPLAELRARGARVLVDAPCSGLGAMRRNPEARWRLREEQLASLQETQAGLLEDAATLVAPHGRLVYAVCSPLRREAEAVVETFAEKHPEFVAVTVRDVMGRARSEPIASADGRYLRTWRFAPEGGADAGDEGMDGFFAAVLRKRRDA